MIEQTPLILNYGNIAPNNSVDAASFRIKQHASKRQAAATDMLAEDLGLGMNLKTNLQKSFQDSLSPKNISGLSPEEDSSLNLFNDTLNANQDELNLSMENFQDWKNAKEKQELQLQEMGTLTNSYASGSTPSSTVFAPSINPDGTLSSTFGSAKQYNIPAALHGNRSNTDSLVIHRTAGTGFHPTDTRLTKDGLGAHITIGTDGQIHQIGNLDNKMWHAGPKYNGRSVGIEIVGRHIKDDQWDPLTPAQQEALMNVGGHIVKKYGIPKENVVNHASIAAKTAGEGLVAKDYFVSNYFGKGGKASNGTSMFKSFPFLTKLEYHESKGDPLAISKSNAKGLFQMKFGKGELGSVLANKLGYDNVAAQTNPDMQREMMALALSGYASDMKKNSITNNSYNNWLYHNQGNTGAKQILSGKLTNVVRNNIYKQGISGNNDYELIQNYHNKYRPIFG